jgi:hypothetical protein
MMWIILETRSSFFLAQQESQESKNNVNTSPSKEGYGQKRNQLAFSDEHHWVAMITSYSAVL